MKNKIIHYRNTHIESRVLLGTVLGELDRISKTPTNEQVIAVIKKMIESNILSGQLDENEMLSQFLPKQLTDIEILNLFELNKFNNIAECMKFFKENYAGLYNGKELSQKYNTYKNV